MKIRLVLLSIVLGVLPLQAQLRVSNLTEGQIGNLPGDKPRDLRTLYNQVTLDLSIAGFRGGLRTEKFWSSAKGSGYQHILQRSVGFKGGGFEVRAGNFYALSGSGLMMHAFELPGVITEDRGSRRRYQIVRDLDGFQVRYRWNGVDLQLWRGNPINSAFPPELNGIDRRSGRIQGGLAEVQPWAFADVGLGLLKLEAGATDEWGGNTYVRLRLASLLEALSLEGVDLEVYGEYAQLDVQTDRWLSLDRDLARALYLSASLGVGALGASFEYKDYRDFQFADLNNPPTLIREHESFLLNRLTHDILADDEAGTQTEVSYSLPSGQFLLANFTTVKRRLDPGGADDLNSWEVFLQGQSPVGESLNGLVFVDVGRALIITDERRLTFGTLWNWYSNGIYALSGDVQYQDVNRTFGVTDFPFESLYLSAELSRRSWTWALTLQRTNDELETGASLNGQTYWWGLNSTVQVREGYSFSLFAGKRRFGLACTGGTCYEVLGFEGVELRVVSRNF
jgi:hypothetical protein